MNLQTFDRLIHGHFGPVLAERGFTCRQSGHSTFHRKVVGGIFHIVMPSRLSHNGSYQIHVFPTCSEFMPDFDLIFPDDVWFPTESFTYLDDSGHGISDVQTKFSCRSEDAFVRSFQRRVEPALRDIAIPYLDQFQSLEDMIPVLVDQMALGIALYKTGQTKQAQKVLKKEARRLEQLGDDGREYREHIRLLTGL